MSLFLQMSEMVLAWQLSHYYASRASLTKTVRPQAVKCFANSRSIPQSGAVVLKFSASEREGICVGSLFCQDTSGDSLLLFWKRKELGSFVWMWQNTQKKQRRKGLVLFSALEVSVPVGLGWGQCRLSLMGSLAEAGCDCLFWLSIWLHWELTKP